MSEITLEEQASPSTPSANKVTVYPKADGYLYIKDDTGTERKLSTDSNAIDSLTDDVVANGPGAASATIQPNVVTDSKLADMPAHTFKANISGSTGDPVNATPAQALAEISPLTTKGDLMVRDASVSKRKAVGADGYVLKADSTDPDGVKWAAETAGGINQLTGDVEAGPGSGSQVAVVKGADDFNHRGNLTMDAANTLSVNSAASPYTIPIHARLILVDTSGGAVTLVLPDPATRRSIKIKDKVGNFGTNQCTLQRFASEQIEGLSANLVLYANFGNYEFTSDGTNWFKTSPSSNIAERIFSSTVAFTFPGGVTKVDAALRPGAGGGGGAGSGGTGFQGASGGGASGGGSGAGGGSANFTLFPGLTITPGTSYTMTIGAGGSGGNGGAGQGTAASNGTAGTAGNAGGSTSFGSLASVGRTSTSIGASGGARGNGGLAGQVAAGGATASGGVAGGGYGLFGITNTSSNGATSGAGGAPGVTGNAGSAGAGLNDAFFNGGTRSGGTAGTGGAQSGGTQGGGGGGAGGGIPGVSDATTQSLTQSGGTAANGSNGTAGSATTSANSSAGGDGVAGVEGRGGSGGAGSGGTGAAITTVGSSGRGGNGGAGSDGKIIVRWRE